MFAQHQPIISQWARADADNLRDVIRFVLLTIRYPLYLAVEDMRDDNPRAMTGARQYAWHAAGRDAREVFDTCENIAHGYHDPADVAAELCGYLATRPAFGLAKAGFVVQLAYGLGGCLDSHNLARFNISQWRFAHYKRKGPRTQARMRRAYVDTCDALGGTADLWDTWCHYVAERDAHYSSAHHVSELHAAAFHLV